MSVFLADEQSERLDLEHLRRLAILVLEQEGFPSTTELTVLLVAESEMASYNQRFLSRDGPTDVLAFPVEELHPGQVPETPANGPPIVVGDVIISPVFVRRQAADLDVDFEDEMALMITHGVLHLLGYDHQEDDDAEVMETREAELLAMVGRKRR